MKELIQNDTYIRRTKQVLVNVGVNDLDSNTAEEVFHQLRTVVEMLRIKYDNPIITLGEITPRAEDKDEEVIKCNDMIREFAATKDYIFVAKHSNLRTDDYRLFSDTKHVKRQSIPIFVSNLKKALRLAHGMPAFISTNRYDTHRRGENSIQYNSYTNRNSDAYGNGAHGYQDSYSQRNGYRY